MTHAFEVDTVPTAKKDTPARMYGPRELWRLSGLPRDRIYKAIASGEMTVYDAGSPTKARYMVSLEDFNQWLETLRVGNK